MLTDRHLSVPTDKSANPGSNASYLVTVMVAAYAASTTWRGGKIFTGAYAPSTLGSFLRVFTFGHAGQLDTASGRFLAGLAAGPRW